jgi:hypothetical protein
MERTGGPLGFTGRTARGARKGTRLRGGLGEHVAWDGLGMRAGPDTEAWYGARGVASAWKNFTVPLFEHVKLQEVE